VSGNTKLSTPKVGSAVEVHFMDHVEDGHKLLPCTVWGRLIKVTAKALVVRSWEAKGVHNSKDWAIARSTVQDLWVLERGGE